MRHIQPFKLERLFAEHEFSAKYLLSPSDCEPLSRKEVLIMMDFEDQEMLGKLHFGYTETQGHPQLRQQITHLYEKAQASRVVVGAPEELIFLGLNALLEKGDHVIIIKPNYQSLQEIPASLGCRIDFWELEVKDCNWTLSIEKLKGLINPKTKALILNFPHNPTGFIPEEQQIDEIIAIARVNGVYIFSDEMYRGLEFSGNRTSLSDKYELTISLSGLSKSYSCPGLRIGWLIVPNQKIMDSILMLKDYTTICNSALSEVFGITVLKNAKKLLETNRKTVSNNHELVQHTCERHKSLFSFYPSMGGSTVFVQLNPGVPFDMFFKSLLEDYGVMVVGGEFFQYNQRFFRIGLGRKNLSQILDLLEDYFCSLSRED